MLQTTQQHSTMLQTTQQYATMLQTAQQQHATMLQTTQQHSTMLQTAQQHSTMLQTAQQHATMLQSTQQHTLNSETCAWKHFSTTQCTQIGAKIVEEQVLHVVEECTQTQGLISPVSKKELFLSFQGFTKKSIQVSRRIERVASL